MLWLCLGQVVLNCVVIDDLSVFIFDHAKPTINLRKSFIAWARWKLVNPYLFLYTAILAHCVYLIFLLRFLVMRNCTKFFLLTSLIDWVEVMICWSMVAYLAWINITCVTLLEVTRTHFYLSLLGWVWIGLTNCHVNLLIIFLVTCATKLILWKRAMWWRFQITVIHVPAIKTTFRARSVGCQLIGSCLLIQVRKLYLTFVV